jgi:hypothetical protein
MPLIRRVLVRMIGIINSWLHTLNYVYTLAIQHYLSFTQFTVHRCGLLPPRTSLGYLLPRTYLKLLRTTSSWTDSRTELNCLNTGSYWTVRELLLNWKLVTETGFIWNSYNLRTDYTENISASIVACLSHHCVATVAMLSFTGWQIHWCFVTQQRQANTRSYTVACL